MTQWEVKIVKNSWKCGWKSWGEEYIQGQIMRVEGSDETWVDNLKTPVRSLRFEGAFMYNA